MHCDCYMSLHATMSMCETTAAAAAPYPAAALLTLAPLLQLHLLPSTVWHNTAAKLPARYSNAIRSQTDCAMRLGQRRCCCSQAPDS
jgi:hypothetical protein